MYTKYGRFCQITTVALGVPSAPDQCSAGAPEFGDLGTSELERSEARNE